MKNKQENIFTIACDMDDVLMVPHTYIGFSKYLGVYEQFSKPLLEYKSGNRAYESLWEIWYNIMSRFSVDDKTAAIKNVVKNISEETYSFVDKAKKLGRFIIVSNNDGDLVKSIAGRFNVENIDVNKYIFQYSLITQRKSNAISEQNLRIDTAITDDLINEKDFLDLPPGNDRNILTGIILTNNEKKTADFNLFNKNYKLLNSLSEVYEHLVSIKSELYG